MSVHTWNRRRRERDVPVTPKAVYLIRLDQFITPNMYQSAFGMEVSKIGGGGIILFYATTVKLHFHRTNTSERKVKSPDKHQFRFDTFRKFVDRHTAEVFRLTATKYTWKAIMHVYFPLQL
jgi:hypothetical protein